MAPFEYFEHTADIGMRCAAPSFAELLEAAATGFSGLLLAEGICLRETCARSIVLPPGEPAYLLFDWLNELLFLFETERFVVARAVVTGNATVGIKGQLGGETFDSQRHGGRYEVKAVTYHRLNVGEYNGFWSGEVIFDL